VLAVALLAACSSSGASGPPKSTVSIVGDSLSVLGDAQITDQLSQAGWKSSISAFAGVNTLEQMPILAEAAHSGSFAFVVELGTNDGHQILKGETTPTAERAQIAAALDLFGTRCVVWVNVDDDPARPGGTGGGSMNQALAAEAARRPNLHIASLRDLLAVHPEYLVSDQVHLTDAGYVALGQLIATTLGACR